MGRRMSLTDEILRVTNSILSERTRAWLGWDGSPYSSLSAREDLRNSERIGWDEGISIEEKEFVITYAAIAFEYVRNQRLDALDIPSSDAANLAQWIATQLEASKVRQTDAPTSSAPITERVAWVSVLARNLKTALARPTMVRAPRPILDGMLEIRAGRYANETKPELRPAEKLPLDRTGRTFRTFADAPLLRIVHEQRRGNQLALFLPVIGKDQRARVKPGQVDVGVFGRELLSGSLLRTYMAMWALANEDGFFRNEPKRVLVEMFGARTVNAGVKKSDGTQYKRLHSKIAREWNEDFDKLLHCYVESLGDYAAINRQPLIAGVADNNTGAEVFEHATLARMAMLTNFVQVPLEALRLDPRSIPLALNVASLWRACIRNKIIRGPGRLILPLRDLAIALRDDPDARSRHDGATAYWKKFQERITEVVREGGLGTIQITGDGPTASVVMVPSESLASVYSSLGELPTPPLAPRPTPTVLQLPSPSRGRRRKSPRLPDERP